MTHAPAKLSLADGTYVVKSTVTPGAVPRTVEVRNGQVFSGSSRFTLAEFFCVNKVVPHESSSR